MINNTGALKLVGVPTGSPASLQLVDASAAAGLGPWASVLYVDQVRGNDLTGARGNANLPFATIQAAINAALTDDTVQLAPQNFAITVAITIPAALIRVGLLGVYARGNGSTTGLGTRISCAGDDAFNLGANLGLSRISFVGLYLSDTTAGKVVVRADGSAYAKDTFLANAYFENCTIIGDVAATYAGGFTFHACTCSSLTSWVFTDGSNVVFNGGTDAGPVVVTCNYDTAHALTRTVQALIQINGGSTLGVVTCSGQSRVTCDVMSSLGGLIGSSLSATTKFPSFTATGRLGAVNFGTAGAELPDTATALTLNFAGAVLYGNAYNFKVGGGAVNFQTVTMNASIGVIVALFTANVKIHVTMRAASLTTPIFATPGADGDIIPPRLSGTIDLSAGAAAAATTWATLGYGPFVRAGAAPDSAFLTSAAQLADAVIAARTTVGLTLTATAAVGNVANWQAVWN